MGTPTPYNRHRMHRGAAVRGIDAETPLGWSVPEPAERLASFAKSMGWSVASNWGTDQEDGLTFLSVSLGRMLYPGENNAAKGDRWLYRIIWVEVPDDDRPNGHCGKMRIAVCRALTPTTGMWQDGPSLKMITELVGRHPKPLRRSVSVQPVKIKADPEKVG